MHTYMHLRRQFSKGTYCKIHMIVWLRVRCPGGPSAIDGRLLQLPNSILQIYDVVQDVHKKTSYGPSLPREQEGLCETYCTPTDQYFQEICTELHVIHMCCQLYEIRSPSNQKRRTSSGDFCRLPTFFSALLLRYCSCGGWSHSWDIQFFAGSVTPLSVAAAIFRCESHDLSFLGACLSYRKLQKCCPVRVASLSAINGCYQESWDLMDHTRFTGSTAFSART